MKTFNRVCIKDYSIVDQEGNTATVEKGKKYLTSNVNSDGEVKVFSKFWVFFPFELFTVGEIFTDGTFSFKKVVPTCFSMPKNTGN